MKKNSLLSVIILCTTLILILVGCGNKEDTTNVSANEQESEADLKLVHDGKLTFAMSGLLKPLNYKDNGKLVGFDVEIGTEIAKRIGLEPNPVTNPWETILQGLKGNKYDVIIGSMTATEERSKQVDFSDPYYISGAQIFVAETNDTVKTKDDLGGKSIGVMQASTHKEVAETLSNEVKGYPSEIFALQDLIPGRIDAVITDKIVGVSAIKEQGMKIKTVDGVLNREEIAVAINKDHQALLDKINEAIAEIIEDGTYEKISMKWFGVNIMED
ncbi:amino acid ABC transporter substrate-binding protein, PAAT family [Psychrobacillus sp. OK028]|uniref:transporter substrate-binding domain-containing protein n=1 Tax=Psychrobacillus sp. OK028 TaxID=1884359 RepID=UPI0008834EAB|nr:transporter substrate-binding domain-containing protein [Psychrobacillus sp. OK028]SDO02033.1 amino acid ABC transporter substrate-binding protein, PAAT family [Psychrobacillus sp. OK028]